MSIPLRIEKLHLTVRGQTVTYEFSTGLNVVSGSYGTGKSSMFELVKFALGSQNAQIMPTIRENLDYATIEIIAWERKYRLTRRIGKNQIDVTFPDGTLERWSAVHSKLPRAAIRLLEVLQIPVTRLGKKSQSEPLTFFDFFRFSYLPQTDINSSVAGHKDPFLNRKRKAAFELAYGLTDERLQELGVQASALAGDKERIEIEADAINRFLVDFGAPETNELDLDEERISTELEQANQRLRYARTLARSAISTDQQSLRLRISELRQRVADVETARSASSAAVERGRALIAQVNLELERSSRSWSAASSLSGLDFAVCPRCLQDVSDRNVPHGHCLLCLQPQDLTDDEAKEHRRTVERLQAQRAEAEFLLKEDQSRLDQMTREAERLRTELNEAASELERQADPDLLLPSLDMSSDAAADRERLRSRLRDIERYRDLWDQAQCKNKEVDSIVHLLRSNQSERDDLREQLESNRERIGYLSQAFQEEIQELKFAGYEEAHVDQQSYLPVINGHKFEELSVSGARKTLANVCYYLANLTTALSVREISFPGLLILDSPRTSLGDTAEDIAAGQRLYWRMHLLSLAYPGCQIIVADNGIPRLERDIQKAMNVIGLSYDSPLLPQIDHPGRRVKTIGSE